MIRSTAAVNDTLRDFAAGYGNDLDYGLADFMAPWVPCGTAIGQYKKFDDSAAFALYDSARAVGGRAQRIEFLATDPAYNCQPNALEIPIDDSERPGAVVDIDITERAKSASVVQLARLSSANRVAVKGRTLAATVILGGWGDGAVDPVAEIDSIMRTVETSTGRLPNRLAFGSTAWERFKNHRRVVDRHASYVLVDGPIFMAVGLFANPVAKILVATEAGRRKTASLNLQAAAMGVSIAGRKNPELVLEGARLEQEAQERRARKRAAKHAKL